VAVELGRKDASRFRSPKRKVRCAFSVHVMRRHSHSNFEGQIDKAAATACAGVKAVQRASVSTAIQPDAAPWLDWSTNQTRTDIVSKPKARVVEEVKAPGRVLDSGAL
jgi:hypothetical protein